MRNLLLTTIAAVTLGLAASSASAAPPGFGIYTPGGGVEIGPGGPRFVTPQQNESLRPWEIRRILRDQGYDQIQILDQGRWTYTVQAVSTRGGVFILTVSARTGEIRDRRWAGRAY